MNYITLEDLNSFIKQNVIDDLSENNYLLLNQIEGYSISEIDANIGFKFDTIAALKSKHPFLLMILIDIFAYHLASRMTHTSMQEIKTDRYESAKSWLKDVATGKIVPNLPMKEPEAGEYKSENKYITDQRYSYTY